MARVSLLVAAFLLISIEISGQCTNSPTVTLTRTSGSICGITAVTVTGNTFGGSAKKVTITEDGAGSVSPASSTKSPFSFTYTPKNGDSGKKVTITVTTDNPLGLPCAAAKATFTLTVGAIPSSPEIGTITKPTCTVPTGSVVLNRLPSTGTWTLTRNPGGILTPGTGTSVTISLLAAGTYTFTVTNSDGCTSSVSSNAVIPAPPAPPASPVQTTDCALGAGKAVIKVTSPTGTGLTYGIDGGAYQEGVSFSSVANGTHIITVRNSSGCTTAGASFLVSCGCVNPPTVALSSNNGSTCSTLPVTVSGNIFGGSATSVSITENGAGIVTPASTVSQPFAFTYNPAAGDAGHTVIITVTTNNPLGIPCAAATAVYTLSVNAGPSAPLVGVITQPSCMVPTGSAELSGLPATGVWELTRSPGGVIIAGTGTGATISGLTTGIYTFTVANSEGCVSGASANVVINAQTSAPTTPVIASITQPSCTVSTGSVVLSGLPSTGTWTLTRAPGSVLTTGSGTSATITNLPEGIFTYSVTNSSGCTSPSSSNIVITAQQGIPQAPLVGSITAPACSLSTGSVVLNGLPSTGTWMLTRYPGTLTTGGTGTSTTVSDLPGGTYNFTLTNAAGCVSGMSANVIIPLQPAIPSPPVIGAITQPVYELPTGSVILNGLPESGSWTLTLMPGNIAIPGTGITKTISGLDAGTYSFTVTNTAGCTSGLSASFGINGLTGTSALVITNPAPVCFPTTVDLTEPKITEGSTSNLTYTYWTDESGTIPYRTPGAATTGTYYIKGTATGGFSTVKPVTVLVYRIPVANAGPDQVLSYLSETTMAAELAYAYESGVWSIISGTGDVFDSTYAKTSVTRLSADNNIFLWTVTNGVCPPSSDTVMITVHEILIPTLITPNMDGKNDYFVVNGSEVLGRIELVIFDRRGNQAYKNENYDNLWNGVDYNGKPLPDDTYFYVIKTENRKSMKGFVVIKH
jgi:gliding motility-associated-like protein